MTGIMAQGPTPNDRKRKATAAANAVPAMTPTVPRIAVEYQRLRQGADAFCSAGFIAYGLAGASPCHRRGGRFFLRRGNLFFSRRGGDLFRQ